MSDSAPIRVHDDVALFREALTYTAAETGFIARLIEKDYFCTVSLDLLARSLMALGASRRDLARIISSSSRSAAA